MRFFLIIPSCYALYIVKKVLWLFYTIAYIDSGIFDFKGVIASKAIEETEVFVMETLFRY